jgi:hypothetical protein
MTLPVDARLVPRPDVAAREINDGAVLVNMGSGACFELNRIGVRDLEAARVGVDGGGSARRWAGDTRSTATCWRRTGGAHRIAGGRGAGRGDVTTATYPGCGIAHESRLISAAELGW